VNIRFSVTMTPLVLIMETLVYSGGKESNRMLLPLE
jgi:hypothetical protein